MRIRNLLGRVYREEDTGNPGGGGGGGNTTGGTGGVGDGDAGIKSFRDSIPEEYRSHSALADYKDLAGLVKSHISLQGMIGNSVAIPKAEDQDGWKNFYKKLGVPESAEGYQFDLGEQFKNIQLNGDTAKWAQGLFHGANLTPSQANKLMQGYLTKEQEIAAAATESVDKQVEAWQDQLEQELGDKYEETTLHASRAASRFFDEDTRRYLEESGVGNHPGLVKAFATIGKLLGEDKVFTDGANNSGFMESPEEARLQISKLNTDTEFQAAYMNAEHPGHKDAVERMRRLYAKAYPGKIDQN